MISCSMCFLKLHIPCDSEVVVYIWFPFCYFWNRHVWYLQQHFEAYICLSVAILEKHIYRNLQPNPMHKNNCDLATCTSDVQKQLHACGQGRIRTIGSTYNGFTSIRWSALHAHACKKEQCSRTTTWYVCERIHLLTNCRSSTLRHFAPS